MGKKSWRVQAVTQRRKNPAAVALGRRGGRARAKLLTPARRAEIARMGGIARANRRKTDDRNK